MKTKKTTGLADMPLISGKIRKRWIRQGVISLWIFVILWVLVGTNNHLGGITRNMILESLSPENDWLPLIKEVFRTEGDFIDTQQQMVLPVSGIVTMGYGWAVGKDRLGDIWHGGMSIKAENAQPVKAAASGVIQDISLEKNKGYRITISHHQELTSIYGNLESIQVKRKQEVRQGEVLGKTGHREIYFEIRVKGTPVDPLNYLRNRSQNV